MICTRPFTIGTLGFGCGQCQPCRINRSRLWSWRIYLESLCHDQSSFVTLTYEVVPDGGTLQPRDLQLWLKRIRKVSPRPLRFFAVGEYGDQTQRPHYHCALFGLGVLDTDFVSRTWNLGYVHVGELNQATARYIAGYVIKKMTHPSDARLNGRHPEFARMSNRPGIGAQAAAVLATQLRTPLGQAEIAKTGDVPTKLKLGAREIPLARYLRQRIRKELQLDPDFHRRSVDALTLEQSLEVSALLENTIPNSPSATPRQVIVDRDVQKARNVVSRSKFNGGRSL